MAGKRGLFYKDKTSLAATHAAGLGDMMQKESFCVTAKINTCFITSEDAVWCKGNLHCHSTFSDGTLSPEALKHSYLHHGFDFLSITDHDVFTDCQALSDSSFTLLNGVEITGYTPNEKRIHLNIFWDSGGSPIEPGRQFRVQNSAQTMLLLRELKAQGCYVMLNHPHWSMLQSSDVLDMEGYDAVELYNYSTEWIENMGEGSIFWEELLSRGRRLWGGGSDDNHNRYPMDSHYCDSFGGFTVVKAKERSATAILEALRVGSFYTSTGPAIYDFRVENGMVHLLCSPCVRIFVNGNARQYKRVLGKFVTEFHVELTGNETFVRAECMDAAGRTAYSNPIFLDAR